MRYLLLALGAARRSARTRRGGPETAVAALAVAALVAGCTSPSHPLLTEEVRTRTTTVETTTLEETLTAPPQTLAEAERAPPHPLELPRPPERTGFEIAEVRKAVLENNLGLTVELTRPSITREQVAAQRAKFEPSLSASPSIARTDPDPSNLNRLGASSTTGSGDVKLRFPLRAGGTVELTLSGVGASVDAPNTPDTYDSALGFSISQPLLRGAGTEVNEASITVAELQHSQEVARTKAAIIGILARAESSYWRLYAAERVLEVRYQQYERAREQQRQAERLTQAGVVPAIDVVRAQSGVSSRVESIIVAETARRRAERELKREMNLPGLDLDSPTAVVTTTEPRPVRLDVDARVLAREAVDSRMEILELELQAAIDTVRVDTARNLELPLLNVDYRYAYLGSSQSFGHSLDRVFARHYPDWQLGLSFEVPLGNRAAQAERRRAALQRALTLSTRADREQVIRQEVLDAADNLSEAWQRILAARQETIYAGRTYAGERKLFLNGVRTSTDVLDALNSLSDAQVREVGALAGYEIAKVDLAIATGSLLGYGRIRMEPSPPTPGKPHGAPYRLELAGAAPGRSSAEPLSPTLLHEVAAIVERYRSAGPDDFPTAGGPVGPGPDARSSAAAGPPIPSPAAAGNLADADPSLYTVQVLSGTDEVAVRAFVERNRSAAGELRYFAGRVGDEARYGVVYGLYPDAAAAREALGSLPPELRRRHPWVRRVGSVQATMVP